MSNHVHIEDAILVQTIDDVLRWHTYSRDEEFGAGFDDDVYEFVELALGVVVAVV